MFRDVSPTLGPSQFSSAIPPPSPPFSAHNDPLDDIYGSAPNSPDLTSQPPADPAHEILSDLPSRQRALDTDAYREGLANSKGQYVQEGFDEGFSLGANIGQHVGYIFGVLQGIVNALATHNDARLAEAEGLLQSAKKELAIEEVLGKNWVDEEGIWKWEVEDKSEDVTFSEVANCHPVVRKWMDSVADVAKKWGVDLQAVEKGLQPEEEEEQSPPKNASKHLLTLRPTLTRSTIAPSLVRRLQTTEWQPARPINPADLPKPKPRKIKPPFTRRKWVRRLFAVSAVLGIGYTIDTQFNASAITRSLRTFKTGLLVGIDYKINFRAHPPLAASIEHLHERNAVRVFDLLGNNGGLYLKIGQAIAMQSAILPPAFQKMFAKMFDDAPQNDWREVEKVIREDFGKSPEEVFGVSFSGEPGKGVMEKTARASASVAQVHWARLADGREVAIKIQKKEIARQVGWDLWAFKVVAFAYSWWFKIPMYSLVPYISERLMLETDFENEADNAEEMRKLVAGESRLNGRVYIPEVYRDLSSKRVMTAEWIEGVRLWDKAGITNRWQGGWRAGSPGAGGAKLPPIRQTNGNPDPNVPAGTAKNGLLKPDRLSWKGHNGKGGLGVSLTEVMGTIVDLFSAQMFLWGLVHCDPHPGNIFIRRLPSGKPEVVLIDHGLYIRMNPKFRHQYALFWKSLLAFDNDTIKDIVSSWGVNNPDIFASATLMRPYQGGDNSTLNELRNGATGKDQQERAYEMQVKARDGIKQILGDETKWPRELIFIGRNLRIVQGNNQFLGSPVNRIKITGLWASRALTESLDLSYTERWSNWVKHLRFRSVLVLTDIVFLWSRLRQALGLGRGMEEDIEERMRVMAKDFGVELNHGVFEG
ncbi:ABC1-domain-containing protein [Aaosphaeria arxii CBS 175.79]|uniref:ABC1-domain-containing protein n=1 Tax=Aaosphaeria arxii CBS 175.79 TaxID=1450172 RepID=A0A6A5Y9X1_9PLEO|nr:ABC1-domain-containing protein [Aaosphaeria arxii CBS 175.79]KAF2022228.1 ABC1-domain-containing protein [Aaosphaeria arxii CBS 175.79]